MQCYTELTPPTAVSHSISLPFTSSKSSNLIIAKTSLLQIFDFKSVVTEAQSNQSDEDAVQDLAADTLDFTGDITLQKLEYTTKLLLVSEYPLSGTISSLGRVKTLNSKYGTEALLVAFRDAKISMVQWDPERHSISTISIHYYENAITTSPWAPDLNQCPSYLSVDPSNKCAILRFGPRQIAIIPFRQLEDDLAEDDYDPILDGPREPTSPARAITNGNSDSITPYAASFVLSLTTLDPNLTFPIHLAFLHEYREPTFGILSATRSPSASASLERRDIVTYKVFTLDLEQKASTTILSVPHLPTDVYRIVPLPLPVGGAILIGPNLLIHIDQAGKTTAIGVNAFAKQSSNFAMADQSHLDMRLEGCTIEQFGDTGDLLVVLANGDLALVSFVLDGRSVATIKIHKVTPSQGGDDIPCGVCCASSIGRGKIFLGNEDNDSIILGWSRKTTNISRKRSHVNITNDEDDFSLDEDDIDDDDDIYGGGESGSKTQDRVSVSEPIAPETLTFRIHDRLPNLAPVGDVVFGRTDGLPSSDEKELDSLNAEMVCPNGRGRDGGILLSRREIISKEHFQMKIRPFSSAWSFYAKPTATKDLAGTGQEALLSADSVYHQFVIISQKIDQSTEESSLYSVTSTALKPTDEGDFDTEGSTIDVGIIANGAWIVHVKTGELRCYNSDFGLEQIIEMHDDVNDVDLSIIRASFCDPYVLVLRDDASIIILELDKKSGELVEMSGGDDMEGEWQAGHLYKPSDSESQPLALLTNSIGGLKVFELPNLNTPIYSTDALPHLPGIITDEFVRRRNAARETLSDVVLADIGDSTSKSTYLIAQTDVGEIIIYQPFHYATTSGENFFKNVRWLKISQPTLPKYVETSSDEEFISRNNSPLRIVDNVGGYSTVVGTWPSPCFVLKEASTMPKVVRLSGGSLNSIDAFHTANCDRGFISVDSDGILRTCQLPLNYRYGDIGWPTRKIRLEAEVSHVCFFPEKGLYGIAATEKQAFRLPEDDNHKEWVIEETAFPPKINRGYLKLLHPTNWTVIDRLALDDGEICISMTVANLEVSEVTHERRPFVCIGTMVIAGEDQQTRGKVYVLDVPDVVPEPDRPETGHKFKVHAKEDVKGGVTALAEIGPQGFLLVAQGQKCLVRGLIETDKLLPVAIMDVQCFVTVAKVLKGTGMILLGDIAKGLWFTGYTEEPYKMTVFSKAAARMEVMAAEFLPQEKQLYILIADADKNIHVLQYDPENPKSLSGRRLIHKTTFHIGHFPVSMHLLSGSVAGQSDGRTSSPSLEDGEEGEPMSKRPLKQVLVTTQTGTLGLMTPVDELMYLRLNTLQTYLSTQLEHPCGLNARGYRAVESERTGIKGVLDGTILKRWTELPKQRRTDVCLRMGVEESSIRLDLERIVGGNLA